MANQRAQTEDQNQLVVESLRKSFRAPDGGELEVLRDVSFSVDAGEFVAIVGVSGAGKSTLLQLIGGLEAPNAGFVRFRDFEVTRASSARLDRYRNAEVGFVFQFHHLLPDMTAVENVALPLSISRAGWHQSLLRAHQALEALGMGDRVHHRIGQLSGGEQQRVALARALINGPRLVLADEPTGNLDSATGEELGALLRSYCHQRGAIIVIATHNAHLAGLCDRTLVLADGKLTRQC